MPLLRTSLVALAVGAAAVSTGVVATSATATPAPVSAVTASVPATDLTPGSPAGGSPAGGSPAAGSPAAGSPAAAGIRPGGRVRAWWTGLTDAQRQCLEDANLRRPVGPLDDAERATLRSQVEAAATACGVELPFARARAFWDGLSDTQRQCLDEAHVTRPLGPLSQADRHQLRQDLAAAATQCGVTLPTARS